MREERNWYKGETNGLQNGTKMACHDIPWPRQCPSHLMAWPGLCHAPGVALGQLPWPSPNTTPCMTAVAVHGHPIQVLKAPFDWFI